MLQLVTASIKSSLHKVYWYYMFVGVVTLELMVLKVSVSHSLKGTSIGQFTRLLRSLELRAVSHCTVLLLWDQKLFFRKRDCFEGSIIHLPTI